MKSALKAGAGLLGLSMILASCGSTGVAPDGSASLVVRTVRTDLRDQNNQYVACDNVVNAPGSTSTTNVATTFSLSGGVNSVQVNLRGVTNSRYDNNYVATFTAREIANVGSAGSDYKVSFKADSASKYPGDLSGFLPQSLQSQSIVVNPVDQTIYVKSVTTSPNDKQGAFYSYVTVNSSTNQSFSATSQNLAQIAVYSQCTYIAPTNEAL